jgi:hypothetical protein
VWSLVDQAWGISATQTIDPLNYVRLVETNDTLTSSGITPISGSASLSDQKNSMSAPASVAVSGYASLVDRPNFIGIIVLDTISCVSSLADGSTVISATGVFRKVPRRLRTVTMPDQLTIKTATYALTITDASQILRLLTLN